MGGSSFKKIFSHKKKKSPLSKAWKKVRRALPTEKRKKRSAPLLDKLNLGKQSRKKNSQKKKWPPSLKRLSLANIRKESTETASPAEKKDGGALGKLGEQMRRKMSRENSKRPMIKQEGGPPPVNLEETQERKESDSPKTEEKVPKRKLRDIIKSIRPMGAKASKGLGEKEA